MLNTSLSLPSKRITKHDSTNFTKLDCPVGANCTVPIKSKSNFYGYKTNGLSFLPWPRGFYCSGSQCNTIKSCNRNRIGILCGRCIESYVESFLSSECISVDSCQSFIKVWLVYCFYALILATIMYYLKDFVTLIKTTVRNSSKIFQSSKKEKKGWWNRYYDMYCWSWRRPGENITLYSVWNFHIICLLLSNKAFDESWCPLQELKWFFIYHIHNRLFKSWNGCSNLLLLVPDE